jgi:Fe-S-cluster containining protein
MCGCCCRRVGDAIKQGIEFPYKATTNGVCVMLKNNKCSVYYNRPTICNIDNLIKILGVNKKDYYKESIRACNQMMDVDGISIEFRIKN